MTKLLSGVDDFNQISSGCALTVGNFDGVHLGHQALLNKLREEGNHRNLPVAVMIFEPQPLELFSLKEVPARITSLREKICYLSKYGINYIVCIRFNKKFSLVSAKDFIDYFLIQRLNVRFLIVGDDFRFGANRKGDFLLLKKASLKYGFSITSKETVFFKKQTRISSTAIRQALKNDKLEVAENMLGHPFAISGRVIYGNRIGRTIGFPTANILLHRQVSPVNGVYAVEITGFSEISSIGIANIGMRPTVKGTRQQLEVHLFDINVNLYGQYISVILKKKIRNERHFSSLVELKEQILIDELIARKFFDD